MAVGEQLQDLALALGQRCSVRRAAAAGRRVDVAVALGSGFDGAEAAPRPASSWPTKALAPALIASRRRRSARAAGMGDDPDAGALTAQGPDQSRRRPARRRGVRSMSMIATSKAPSSVSRSRASAQFVRLFDLEARRPATRGLRAERPAGGRRSNTVDPQSLTPTPSGPGTLSPRCAVAPCDLRPILTTDGSTDATAGSQTASFFPVQPLG